MSRPAGVAFFDVDETLVSVRTLESFLLHYLRVVPSMISPGELRELAKQVTTLDRSEFNRRYYRVWAGEPVDRVFEEGRRWYAAASQESGFYRPNVLELLREHQRSGDRVVLVSGSFGAPLRPLADALGVDALYCTELEARDGAFTGEISATMIGDDKARAVAAYLAAHGHGHGHGQGHAQGQGDSSWGYGDHSSDLPLLEHVTSPIVVGSDPVMLELAEQRGWPVLPVDQPLAPRA